MLRSQTYRRFRQKMSVLFFVFGKLRTGTLDQLIQRCAEASPSLGKFSLENLPLFHIKREKLHFGGARLELCSEAKPLELHGSASFDQ